MNIYMYTYIYMYIYICTCICTYIHIYLCVCIYIYIHVDMHIYAYTYMYIYIFISIYPPAPMNHVKHLRAGPAEMHFRNWYIALKNHFYLQILSGGNEQPNQIE